MIFFRNPKNERKKTGWPNFICTSTSVQNELTVPETHFAAQASSWETQRQTQHKITWLSNLKRKESCTRSAGIIPDYATFIDALYGRGLFGRKTYYAEVFKLVCEKLSVNSVRDLDRCIKATRDPERDQCGLPLSPSQIFDFSTIQQTIISLFLRLGRFEHETGIDEMFQTGMIPYFWEEV